MPTGQDILNQLNQYPYKEAPPTTQPLQPANMNALLAALGQGLMKPVDAAQNIMGQGDRPPSQMTIDPGQEAFNAGPMAISRVFGMAPSNSIGVTSSRLMQRTDVVKMIKEAKAQGITSEQIAKNINDRFAPLLDQGVYISKNNVDNTIYRMRRQGIISRGEDLPVYSSQLNSQAVRSNQDLKDLQTWQSALPNATGGRKAMIEAKIKELQDKINGR